MADPKWAHPEALEQEYTKTLRQYARRCRRASNQMLMPEVAGLVEKAALRGDAIEEGEDGNNGTWADDLRNILSTMLAGIFGKRALEIFRSLPGPASAEDIGVAQYGEQVQRFNLRQFQRLIRRKYDDRYTRAEPQLAALMRAWELENLKLIRSIPEQYIDRLQGVVTRAVAGGGSVTDVKEAIRATYQQPMNRADLIARDQISKLNSQITRYRQEAIGIKSYIWRGVLDSRERQEHVAREGREFQWSKPPSDGHAGIPINCRCYPSPVWPPRDEVNLHGQSL